MNSRLTAAIARFCTTVMSRRREEPGVSQVPILRMFSEEEVTQVVERWLDVFGRHPEAEAFLWHVFSGGLFPSLKGEAAVEAYRQHLAPQYVVLSNNRRNAFVTDVPPPPEANPTNDYYVFPPNLAWSMAFTHHDFDSSGPSGPYFARHPDYLRLNEANLAELEKKLRQSNIGEKAAG